jgi:hypothetical protein
LLALTALSVATLTGGVVLARPAIRTPPPADQDAAEQIRAREAFERRHYLGLQAGGTGIFQFAYRLRTVDRLHLDLGGFALNGMANASAGLLYDVRLGDRTAVYAGVGGGVIPSVGENACDDPEQCTGGTSWRFVYSRAGLALRFGAQHRDVLGVDVGVWRGWSHETRPGLTREESFTWPMVGLSYHYAL